MVADFIYHRIMNVLPGSATLAALMTISCLATAAGVTSLSAEPAAPGAPARALEAYNAGLAAKESAWNLEAQADAAARSERRNDYQQRAQSAYALAVEHQRAALKANPTLAEAANELGYALRKTGKPRDALRSYNYALLLNPNLAEARQYRAEALLTLGEFDATRTAYVELSRSRPDLAAQLMQTFQRWRAGISDTSNSAARDFASWVDARNAAPPASGW